MDIHDWGTTKQHKENRMFQHPENGKTFFYGFGIMSFMMLLLQPSAVLATHFTPRQRGDPMVGIVKKGILKPLPDEDKK